MADDWAVGDLALCVDDSEWSGEVFAPWNVKVGGLYRVTGVDGTCDEALLLDLAEDPFACDDYGWDCRRFRKIRPLTDEERDSFLADLDAPVSPAAPSRSHAGDRPNDDASTPSPLANPASSLPESVSAPNRDALSGSLFNPVHDREVSHP